jgi:hypothetical protein
MFRAVFAALIHARFELDVVVFFCDDALPLRRFNAIKNHDQEGSDWTKKQGRDPPKQTTAVLALRKTRIDQG